MTRRTLRSFSLALLLPLSGLGSCTIPNTIELLDDTQPPPEFGRPGWVRTFAGVGGWVGGIVGGAVSVVLLPITWPLSELADEGLGEHASDEFLLFPATAFAAGGHALFGLPADLVDFTFRRAWVGSGQPITSYEFVPMPPPQLPRVAEGDGDGEMEVGGDAVEGR